MMTSSIQSLPQYMAKRDYRLDFSHFLEHLVEVSLTFIPDTDNPSLWLPAWIPGSYLMREFARNITAVHYQSQDNATDHRRYRAQKVDKNTWQLPEAKAGEILTVYYEVYCYDLSVRTAYVDQQRLYGNFTSLALAVAGQEQQAIQVSLIVPAAFLLDKEHSRVRLACGLAATSLNRVDADNDNDNDSDEPWCFTLQADNYHELIDYPFEISEQDTFDFLIRDKNNQALNHRFYLSGRHSANMGRLQQDIAQICQTYLNWLGDAPFDDYTFMTYASGQDYGGLEHINSTSLITPRNDLPSIDESKNPSASYQRFLGLCSHEYFHAWWVKTVRPDVMLDVDLSRESYTPLLWVFEGFTSYIDDFMLQASAVIDKASYLTLLAEQISRYYQTDGRAHQSVAESSFDAWIKLYRSDENTANAGISYYNKGALVALCLDLILLKKSGGQHRIFDVVKTFYEQAKQNDNKRIGISSADMGKVVGQYMPIEEWEDFERRYVNGVEELPLDTLLAENGIKMQGSSKATVDGQIPWGIRCDETSLGLKVNRVQRNSPAASAGISAHDVIVAIDGIKADKKELAMVVTAGNEIVCHLFRRDELLTVKVIPQNRTDNSTLFPHKVSLRFSNDAPPYAKDATPLWDAWLNRAPRENCLKT